MQFELAGVMHCDPLGRERLLNWFHSLATQRPHLPRFVAVEWDPDRLPVDRERQVVRTKLEALPLPIDRDVIEALVKTVALEADTHLPVYPTVETLWLDRFREIKDPSDVAMFADYRVEHYASLLRMFASSRGRDLLESISVFLWTNSLVSAAHGDDRDTALAGAILHRSQPFLIEPDAWAAVVLGTNHTRRDPGRVTTLLEQAGGICRVADMRP